MPSPKIELPPLPEHTIRVPNGAEGIGIGHSDEAMQAYALLAVQQERERCANLAAMFSMDPEAYTIHPDIPFGEMSEHSQKVAHTTCQNLAAAIRSGR